MKYCKAFFSDISGALKASLKLSQHQFYSLGSYLSIETLSFKICQEMCVVDAFESLSESRKSSKLTTFII